MDLTAARQCKEDSFKNNQGKQKVRSQYKCKEKKKNPANIITQSFLNVDKEDTDR